MVLVGAMASALVHLRVARVINLLVVMVTLGIAGQMMQLEAVVQNLGMGARFL